MKTWKDISKKFDEKFRDVVNQQDMGMYSELIQRHKSFLHSTLDEYVRELIGEEEPWFRDPFHDINCHCIRCSQSARQEFRNQLLKQHEENLR